MSGGTDDFDESLGIYYSVDMEDTNKKRHTLDLIENGSDKPVKNIND